MPKFSSKLVQHIAKLANLDLDDAQIDLYRDHLGVIVNHFNDLKSLSLTNIPETTQVTEKENAWREDVITSSLSQKEALQNSKRLYRGYFMVPYILKKKQ